MLSQNIGEGDYGKPVFFLRQGQYAICFLTEFLYVRKKTYLCNR